MPSSPVTMPGHCHGDPCQFWGSPFDVDQVNASLQQMEQVLRAQAVCPFLSVALRRGLSHYINFSHFCSMNGQNVHQHPDFT